MLTMKAVGTMVHKTFKNCSGLEANCLVWVKKEATGIFPYQMKLIRHR